MTQNFAQPDTIRADFSAAMSAMYRTEVPAYGDLLEIVQDTNAATLNGPSAAGLNLTPDEDTTRISEERHGAIRLGTADELAMMARVFAVMGMYPVGYYDLSAAAVPVHSTAFRPTTRAALAANPFRVFTSLLRLELITDDTLRAQAAAILAKRQIFTAGAVALTEKAEAQGGLSSEDATKFVAEVLETFRWHADACVDIDTFNQLNSAHRLIADVVSFKGPHINHLTPRTLDIDAAQVGMVERGLPAKAVVEGPPRRDCPILLRQTSFKALEEPVKFPSADGTATVGSHTARFGEIEQRGVALTPKGRDLYDRTLAAVRAEILPAGDGSNAAAYMAALSDAFKVFPDDWRGMYDQGLAHFKFSIDHIPDTTRDLDTVALLDEGVLTLSPIIYEDFLPVSAAGIFQSNLGDDAGQDSHSASSKAEFEKALGTSVADEFALYQQIEDASLSACLDQIRKAGQSA
ncbi:putative glyoxalase superfamily metalloenzyme YdcJ [Yoonia maritima]|uniref:2-oxoadipate dioxygenase/decarboxylase n=1 Tax=Yoonia maritima TaxID=1435347 RepID=A0A2T0VZF7_9RHOB|nr:VOC family protein [Yoonia maritima]PRY77725.1 putative glyoxalase superfamily metalloenzyme YdcJ [Yoonia maritima]